MQRLISLDLAKEIPVAYGKQMSLHQEQVKKKWQKMVHIVDVIKVIGKCGLSQRGSKDEAAYTIKDSTADHGNFLELILLLSKYDTFLQQHVNECIEKIKRQHETWGKGRGSFVSLLSKCIINIVIDVISQLIKTNHCK